MQQMMTAQSIDYVFPFSQFSFPTDVSFVVLCEGKKSAFFQVSTVFQCFRRLLLYPETDVCIQTSLVIPLRPVADDADLYKQAKDLKLPSSSEEKLDTFRSFVCGALEKAALAQGGVGVGEDTAAVSFPPPYSYSHSRVIAHIHTGFDCIIVHTRRFREGT